jgi:hypothetical protein
VTSASISRQKHSEKLARLKKHQQELANKISDRPPSAIASASFFKRRRFFGRGRFRSFWTWFWIDQPTAFNASQPRCGATDIKPSSPGIQAATLRLDHSPPSGGGREADHAA